MGNPDRDIIHIPEASEDDRYVVSGGSFSVKTPGLRVAEYFPDMGHFPMCIPDIPGAEPRTEVKEYYVDVSQQRGEILATDGCCLRRRVAAPPNCGYRLSKNP